MTKSNEVITEWVEKYSNDLYKWAYFKTSNKEIAEDLVQETFLSAIKSFEKFKGNSSPKTWLFTILNNKMIDHFRKQLRNVVVSGVELLPEEGHSQPTVFFDRHGNWRKEMRPERWPDQEVILMNNIEFTRVLQNCIDQLPLVWNACINLKYMEGKKGGDICQELGISASNFWQILYRSRLQLRNCLEHNWFKR